MAIEILGIIDDRGCVHSVPYNQLDQDYPMHDDVWPMRAFSRWRWSEDEGITQLLSSAWLTDPFGVEESDKITRHIKKFYGLSVVGES